MLEWCKGEGEWKKSKFSAKLGRAETSPASLAGCLTSRCEKFWLRKAPRLPARGHPQPPKLRNTILFPKKIHTEKQFCASWGESLFIREQEGAQAQQDGNLLKGRDLIGRDLIRSLH